MEIRTLFVSNAGLENAKRLVAEYKLGKCDGMTPELWQAKKIVDSTLHPGALLFAPSFQKYCGSGILNAAGRMELGFFAPGKKLERNI